MTPFQEMILLNRKGSLIVLSGPSGSGKGTVLGEFFEKYADENVFLSISATTRNPRPSDIDGVTYYFKTVDEFKNMIKNNELLEYASFCDNYYGTPKKAVEDKLNSGVDVILEIEIQGALKVMETTKDAVFVFICPPSVEELEKRLVGRNTETLDVIKKRIDTAKWELTNIEKYDYLIVNETVDDAASKLKEIIDAQRQSVKNNKEFIKTILNEVEL